MLGTRRSLAEYETIRLAVLESVVDGGRKLWRAAKEHRINLYIAQRWFAQHENGEATLSALRAGTAPIAAMEFTHGGVSEISPFRPTETLKRVIARITGCGADPTADEVFVRAAAYVLHPDAPTDHLAAWLRFYVDRWG